MDNNEKFVVSKLRGEDNTTVVSTRMPNRLIDKIEEIIIKTGRNRTQIIVMALEYALDRLEIDESDEPKE